MKHLRILGALLLVLAFLAMTVVILTPSTAPEAMFELGIVEAVDLAVPAYVADIMAEADVGSVEAVDTLLEIPVTMATLALSLIVKATSTQDLYCQWYVRRWKASSRRGSTGADRGIIRYGVY